MIKKLRKAHTYNNELTSYKLLSSVYYRAMID